jgi:cell division protease FtsH
MQYETIDADQLKDIMEGRSPRPPKDWEDGDSGSGSPVTGGDLKPAEPEPEPATDDGDDEEDDEPRRRPSDPLGGPAGS